MCKEAEPLILTNAGWACLYARDAIKSRWAEVEPLISTDETYSTCESQANKSKNHCQQLSRIDKFDFFQEIS